MSFQSYFNVFNALLLLLFIHYISCQAETNESPKTRNEVIDDKRESIKYVVNVLNRLDKGLENLEDSMDFNNALKRDYNNIESKADSNRCLSGIPGGDCSSDLGDWANIPSRNPGKRSVSKRVEIMAAKRGVDCSPIGGLPGADCEWNEMGEEAKHQKLMKSSIRNPGRKRRSLLQ